MCVYMYIYIYTKHIHIHIHIHVHIHEHRLPAYLKWVHDSTQVWCVRKRFIHICAETIHTRLCGNDLSAFVRQRFIHFCAATIHTHLPDYLKWVHYSTQVRRVWERPYTFVNVCIHVYIRVHIHMHIHKHIRIRIHIHVHKYIHIHIYACTYTLYKEESHVADWERTRRRWGGRGGVRDTGRHRVSTEMSPSGADRALQGGEDM